MIGGQEDLRTFVVTNLQSVEQGRVQVIGYGQTKQEMDILVFKKK